jgi:hypothetical protein
VAQGVGPEFKPQYHKIIKSNIRGHMKDWHIYKEEYHADITMKRKNTVQSRKNPAVSEKLYIQEVKEGRCESKASLGNTVRPYLQKVVGYRLHENTCYVLKREGYPTINI